MGAKEELGRFVRQRREELGISAQDDLGAMIGRDQNYISRLERGIIRGPVPEPEELKALAEALQVPIEHLLQAAGYLDVESIAHDPRWERYETRKELMKIRSKLDSVVQMLEESESYDVQVDNGGN